jgi:hypothetical protein
MTVTASPTHEGYLDGMRGSEPDPDWERHPDYATGWLEGRARAEAGATLPRLCGYCKEVDILRPKLIGQKVTIRKGTMVFRAGPGMHRTGTTYRVKVAHVNNGSCAYIDHHGEFVPPTNPEIMWSGSGRYWHSADLNTIPEVT